MRPGSADLETGPAVRIDRDRYGVAGAQVVQHLSGQLANGRLVALPAGHVDGQDQLHLGVSLTGDSGVSDLLDHRVAVQRVGDRGRVVVRL